MLTQRLSYSAKNYTLLCIDEDESILDFLNENLKEFFMTVKVASDSKTALELYKKHNPDIIITNIGYGGSDGLDLSSNLKGYNPKVKILLATNHDDKESLVKALKCGVDYYVKKPINLDELYEGLLILIRSLDVWHHQEEEDNMTIYEPEVLGNKIIEYLVALKNNKTMVKLVNHYKGVEISHKGLIIRVDDEKVYVMVDNVQFSAAKFEGKVLISSDVLEKDILAHIGEKSLSINDKYILELENLSLMDFAQSRRKELRIVPDTNIHISFSYQGTSIDGVLMYVSQNAVCIRMENLSKKLTKDEEVNVNISIKTPQYSLYHSFVQNDLIKCNGTLLRVDEFSTFTQVIILLKMQKTKDINSYSEYLTKRQKDLIAEFGRVLKTQN